MTTPGVFNIHLRPTYINICEKALFITTSHPHVCRIMHVRHTLQCCQLKAWSMHIFLALSLCWAMISNLVVESRSLLFRNKPFCCRAMVLFTLPGIGMWTSPSADINITQNIGFGGCLWPIKTKTGTLSLEHYKNGKVYSTQWDLSNKHTRRPERLRWFWLLTLLEGGHQLSEAHLGGGGLKLNRS